MSTRSLSPALLPIAAHPASRDSRATSSQGRWRQDAPPGALGLGRGVELVFAEIGCPWTTLAAAACRRPVAGSSSSGRVGRLEDVVVAVWRSPARGVGGTIRRADADLPTSVATPRAQRPASRRLEGATGASRAHRTRRVLIDRENLARALWPSTTPSESFRPRASSVTNGPPARRSGATRAASTSPVRTESVHASARAMEPCVRAERRGRLSMRSRKAYHRFAVASWLAPASRARGRNDGRHRDTHMGPDSHWLWPRDAVWR